MPTEYIHFTEEQKQQARQTDLVALLQSQGEHLKRSGKEYVWRDGSDKVTVRGNLWFHQYERIGGDAVDFVRRFYHMDFPQAVGFLLGNNGGTLQRAEPIRREPPKPFALPPKNENMRRVFAYLLNRRGIDRDVLYGFVHKGMIYESADYHNAVFVGCDESGTPRHAHKRGTGSESSYKGNTESSDPRYSFHWTGRDNTLYLFEAPIDMLSFISLHKENWRSHSYAAACCVGDQVLFQTLKLNPTIDTVYLCMDNDAAGQAANKRISDKLFIQGIKHEILVPSLKDWNEDRLAAGGNAPHIRAEFSLPQEESEEEEVCQTLQL
mgnify:FL=1